MFGLIETLSSLAGVVSGFLDAARWLFSWRAGLDVSVLDYKSYVSGTVCLELLLINKTSRPIHITSICLATKDGELDCDRHARVLFRRRDMRGTSDRSEQTVVSLAFPLRMASLEAVSGFVLFHKPRGMFRRSPKGLRLTVLTSQGRRLRMTRVPAREQEGIFPL